MIPAHKLLGIVLHDVKPGHATLSLPFRDELIGDPRSRRLYGGVIACLMDSAGGAAAITTLTSEKDQCSSVDIRVDYMEPGRPADVLCEAEIVRSGNSIIYTKMRAYHPDNGETIAEGRAVYRVKRMRNEQPTDVTEIDLGLE